MADTLYEHFSTEFTSNWISRINQKKSRLTPFVQSESINGERKRYDRIGPVTSRTRPDRNGETPIANTDLDSRWVYLLNKDIPAKLIDPSDAGNLGTLTLPNSSIVAEHAARYNRDVDDIIHTSALANSISGELGTTSTALAAGQKIAVGSTGLTIAKLLTAREILDAADADDDAARVVVCSARDITVLLNTTEVKNADYNTVKALAQGHIDTFMGFKFVRNQRLTTVSTTRSCVAMVQGAVRICNRGLMTTIDKRPDRSNATQIYTQYQLGGVRIHDEAVVQIDVLTTVDGL